jgi:hypothetical protein
VIHQFDLPAAEKYLTDEFATMSESLGCIRYGHGDHSLLLGSDLEAGQQYARRGIQIWRSGAVRFASEEVDVPVVSCLCYEALFQWHFGDITFCHTALAEAISVAKELNDMHAFAVARKLGGESCLL